MNRAKTYEVRWRCGNSRKVHGKSVSAEAGWGNKSVTLNCGGEVNQPMAGGSYGSKTIYPVADSHVYAYSYRNWNKVNWGKYDQ